jgi:hypothetical protein
VRTRSSESQSLGSLESVRSQCGCHSQCTNTRCPVSIVVFSSLFQGRQFFPGRLSEGGSLFGSGGPSTCRIALELRDYCTTPWEIVRCGFGNRASWSALVPFPILRHRTVTLGCEALKKINCIREYVLGFLGHFCTEEALFFSKRSRWWWLKLVVTSPCDPPLISCPRILDRPIKPKGGASHLPLWVHYPFVNSMNSR